MSKKETVEQAKGRGKLEKYLEKEFGIRDFMLIGLNEKREAEIIFSHMHMNDICYCVVSLQEFSIDRLKGLKDAN